MPETCFDAVVIGGGPGGSSTATFLARRGRRVLVLEKERFPRFHIGESLLPYNRALFQEMGVLEKLEASSLIRKYGAQFHLGNGSKSTCFVFSQGRFTRHPDAFQVERATFDDLLLKHARESGAEVREGWTVNRVISNDSSDHVEIETTDPEGKKHIVSGRFLVDASGRGNLTGNQEGIREMNPRLKKIAVFSHFSGVRVDEGTKGGDTVIVRLENKWFWLIPLAADRVSVGCVMDKSEFQENNVTPDERFWREVRGSKPMMERLQNAKALVPIQTISDFSYRNRRFVGHRLVRVGDAAGFMDPIFSAGVYLAMFSGKLAAQLVDEAVQQGTDASTALLAYERRVNNAMAVYWKMVEAFYTTPFMEVFLEPRNRYDIPAAVNAILAGELEPGWRMRWRLKLFFWIVKLQAKWPLVPRVSFAPFETSPSA